MHGTVQKWRDEDKYGFIRPEDGGRDLFVHCSDLPRGVDYLTLGARVSYRPIETPRGGRAVDVAIVDDSTCTPLAEV